MLERNGLSRSQTAISDALLAAGGSGVTTAIRNQMPHVGVSSSELAILWLSADHPSLHTSLAVTVSLLRQSNGVDEDTVNGEAAMDECEMYNDLSSSTMLAVVDSLALPNNEGAGTGASLGGGVSGMFARASVNYVSEGNPGEAQAIRNTSIATTNPRERISCAPALGLVPPSTPPTSPPPPPPPLRPGFGIIDGAVVNVSDIPSTEVSALTSELLEANNRPILLGMAAVVMGALMLCLASLCLVRARRRRRRLQDKADKAATEMHQHRRDVRRVRQLQTMLMNDLGTLRRQSIDVRASITEEMYAAGTPDSARGEDEAVAGPMRAAANALVAARALRIPADAVTPDEERRDSVVLPPGERRSSIDDPVYLSLMPGSKKDQHDSETPIDDRRSSISGRRMSLDEAESEDERPVYLAMVKAPKKVDEFEQDRTIGIAMGRRVRINPGPEGQGGQQTRRASTQGIYASIPPNLTWSQIELSGILGEGRMGRMYSANFQGHSLAVRRVDNVVKSLYQSPEVLKEEWEDLRQHVRHPNLLRYLAFAEDEQGRYGMVLPVCSCNLTLYLQQTAAEVPLLLQNVAQCCDILKQTAQGLAFLHSRQITHGSLWPNNIMINVKQGVVDIKLADYGRSRGIVHYLLIKEQEAHASASKGSPGSESAKRWQKHRSKTASADLHRPYAAPEVLRNASTWGAPADVYALGALLARFAQLETLFTDELKEMKWAELYELVEQGEIQPTDVLKRLWEQNPNNYPEPLCELAVKCCSRNSRQRPLAVVCMRTLETQQEVAEAAAPRTEAKRSNEFVNPMSLPAPNIVARAEHGGPPTGDPLADTVDHSRSSETTRRGVAASGGAEQSSSAERKSKLRTSIADTNDMQDAFEDGFGQADIRAMSSHRGHMPENRAWMRKEDGPAAVWKGAAREALTRQSSRKKGGDQPSPGSSTSSPSNSERIQSLTDRVIGGSTARKEATRSRRAQHSSSQTGLGASSGMGVVPSYRAPKRHGPPTQTGQQSERDQLGMALAEGRRTVRKDRIVI